MWSQPGKCIHEAEKLITMHTPARRCEMLHFIRIRLHQAQGRFPGSRKRSIHPRIWLDLNSLHHAAACLFFTYIWLRCTKDSRRLQDTRSHWTKRVHHDGSQAIPAGASESHKVQHRVQGADRTAGGIQLYHPRHPGLLSCFCEYFARSQARCSVKPFTFWCHPMQCIQCLCICTPVSMR
jgi:hypothetical protein